MEKTLPAPLSTSLQSSTAEAHDRAENAGFITQLLAGDSGPDSLVALLRQSLPVYEALEDACRAHSADPRIAPILDPRLERADSLRADLEAHRAAGRVCDTVLPVTSAYVADIVACADDPAALVGHHYVRYLGDLSGGQIIARLVRRHYGLEDGLSFYDFDIPKAKVFKDEYRAALDALPLSDAERDSAIAAANRSFDLNYQMFVELGALEST